MFRVFSYVVFLEYSSLSSVLLGSTMPRYSNSKRYRTRRRYRSNRRVSGLINVPKYILDCYNLSNAALTEVPSVLNPVSGCTGCLSSPARGNAVTQRDGDRICMESIDLHILVSWSGVGTGQTLVIPTARV
jgi:hypothetical protein